MKKLLIIILHFGDREQTNNCLKSILKNKIKYDEILVINNDSKFSLAVNDQKGKIKIVNNRENLGYAGGMNVGINYGLKNGFSYFLLLNNDTFFENNFITKLTEFFDKNEKVGIAAPAIKFQKDNVTTYDLGGKVNLLFGRTTHNEVNQITNFYPREVDYISGCCMLIKREVFDKVGLFDEIFFLYYEDVDFCLRARKAGFKTYVLPEKEIDHYLSSSIGKNSKLAVYHQTLSAYLFGGKYFYSEKRILNVLFILTQSFYIFLKNPAVGRFAFLGLFHGIHKRSY